MVVELTTAYRTSGGRGMEVKTRTLARKRKRAAPGAIATSGSGVARIQISYDWERYHQRSFRTSAEANLSSRSASCVIFSWTPRGCLLAGDEPRMRFTEYLNG